MHTPLSIGTILLIGLAAIGGVTGGFLLPIPQTDQHVATPASHFSDPQITRLYEGCMAGPFRSEAYSDAIQRHHCGCYAEGAAEELSSRQIELLTVTFENGVSDLEKVAAALEQEFKDLSQEEAAALWKRMNDIANLERRCNKRLYEMVRNDPSTQNADSIRNDSRVTALYDACVIGDDTRPKSPLHVQMAFCECYGRKAVEHLQATEIAALRVGLANGKAALEKHITSMSTVEHRRLIQRLGEFLKTAPQQCLKAGIEAADAG